MNKINIKIFINCPNKPNGKDWFHIECDYHLGLDLDNELVSWVCIVCGDVQQIG